MSLKTKAARIDLGKLVAGATSIPGQGSNPLQQGAPGGGMTAIGIHAESVYRDRKVAEENNILKDENAALLDKLTEFRDSEIAKKLNPTSIRASRWANRNEASFSTPKFKSLKSEIESAGGNVQPIKVRPIPGNLGEYEIVFGHRRHRACLELGLDVLTLVVDLTDADLFAQMDRENRQRADLRPYEQGVMYARALDEGLFASMRKLAESVGVDVGGVSKLVTLARLPSDVLRAFVSPLDIQFQWGPVIAAALQKNPDFVLSRARELASRNPRVNAAQVFRALAFDESTAASSLAEMKQTVVTGKGGATAKISFNEKRGSFEISIKGLNKQRASDIAKSIKALLG
jgi:ParB family chromosome partitioning protein